MQYTRYFSSRNHLRRWNYQVLTSPFGVDDTFAPDITNGLQLYYPGLYGQWSSFMTDNFLAPIDNFETSYRSSTLPSAFRDGKIVQHYSSTFADFGTIYVPGSGKHKVRIAAADKITLYIYSGAQYSYNYPEDFTLVKTVTTGDNNNTANKDSNNSYDGNSLEFEFNAHKGEYLYLKLDTVNYDSNNSFAENPHAFAYTFSRPLFDYITKEEITVSFNTDPIINDYDSPTKITLPVSINISTQNVDAVANEISITRIIVSPRNEIAAPTNTIYTTSEWGAKTYIDVGAFNNVVVLRNLSAVNGVTKGLITSTKSFSYTFTDSIDKFAYDLEYTEIYYEVTLTNERGSVTYKIDTQRKRIYELPRIIKFNYKFLDGNYIFNWYVVNGTVKSLIGKSKSDPNDETIYFDNQSLSNSSTYTIPSSSIKNPGSYKLVVSNAYGIKSTISPLQTSLKYNPADITVSEISDFVSLPQINPEPNYSIGQKTVKAIITLPGKTTITVPQNCVKATVKMWGAGGKDGNVPPGYALQTWFAQGGSGGHGVCDIIVCPGDTIDVYVGKSGEGTGRNKITGQYTSNRGGGWSGIIYGQQHLIVGGGGAGGDYFYDPINNRYFGGGNGGDGVAAFSSGNPGSQPFSKFNSIDLISGTSTDNALLIGKGGLGYTDVKRSTFATHTSISNLPLDAFLDTFTVASNSDDYLIPVEISNIEKEQADEFVFNYIYTIPDFSLAAQKVNEDTVYWIDLKYISIDSYAAVGTFYRRVANGSEILDLNNGGCSVSETIGWKGTVNQTIVEPLDPNLGGGGGGGYYGGFGALMGGGGGGSGNLYNYITFYATGSGNSSYIHGIPKISGTDSFISLTVNASNVSTGSTQTSLSDYNIEASTGTYSLKSNTLLDGTNIYSARYTRYRTTSSTEGGYDPNGPTPAENPIWGSSLGTYDPDYVPGTGGNNQDGAVVITFYTFSETEEKFIFTEDTEFEIPARRRFRMLTAGGAGGAGSGDPATVNNKSYKPNFINIKNDSSLGVGGLGGFGNAIWSIYKNTKSTPKTLILQIGKCGQDGKNATNGIALGGASSFSSGGNGGKVENEGVIVGGVGGGGGGATAIYEKESSFSFKGIKNFNILSSGYYVKPFNPIIDQYNSVTPQENQVKSIRSYGGIGTEATFDLKLKSREVLRYAFGYSRSDYQTLIQDVGYDYNDYTIDILENRSASGTDYVAVGLPRYNEVRIYRNTINSSNLMFTITPPVTDTDTEYFGRSISFSGEHAVLTTRATPFIAIASLSTDSRPKIYIYQFSTANVTQNRTYTGVTNSTYINGRSYSFSWVPYFTLQSVISPPQGTWDQEKDGYFGYTIKLAYFKDPVAPSGTASGNIRNQRLLYVGCPGYNNSTGIVYVYKIAGEITSPIVTGTAPYYNHTNFTSSPSGYSVSFDNSLSSRQFTASTSFTSCTSCFNCSIFTQDYINSNSNVFTVNIGSISGTAQNSYFGYSIANGDRQTSRSDTYGEGRYVYISSPGENTFSGKVYVYDISFEYGVSTQNSITTTLRLNEAADNLHNGDSYQGWDSTTKIANIGNAYSRYTLQHFKIFDNPNPSNIDYFGSKILAFKNSPYFYVTASGEDVLESDNNGKTYRYNSATATAPSRTINDAGRLVLIEEFNVTEVLLADGGRNYEINDELYFDLDTLGFTTITDTLINPLNSITNTELETTVVVPNYCRIKVTDVATDLSPLPVCISAGGGGGGGGVKDLPLGIDSYHSAQSRNIVYPYISQYYEKALSLDGLNASTSTSYYTSLALNYDLVGYRSYSITGRFYYDTNKPSAGPGGYPSSGGGGGGGGCPPGGSRIISPRISSVGQDQMTSVSSSVEEYTYNNITVSYSPFYTIADNYNFSSNIINVTKQMTANYFRSYFDTKISVQLPSRSKTGWVQDPLLGDVNTPGIAGGPGFSVIGTGVVNNRLVTSGITSTSELYLPPFLAGFPNSELALSNNYQPYKVPKNGFVYIELLPQFNILHRLSNGNWATTTGIYVFFNGWRKVKDAFIYSNGAWRKLS